MTIKQGLGSFFIACLLAVGVWYWQTQTVSHAPNFEFISIKGETVNMANLKGKPVLVTFWATDCPGCIEEIPHLINLHQQFSPHGLTIIAVAMDYDPPNRVKAMTESRQLPYIVALDPTAEHAQAFGNVRLTPTTFLIDREGKIALQTIGVFDLSEIQNRLRSM